MLKRSLDIILSLCALAVFFIPCLFVALAIKLTSPGPVLFWSDRVGQNNKIYSMPKFRSMRTDSPQIATHLFTDARSYITPIGRFLRKSSVDELPQLWSILKGDMSIVGPRPALFNQEDLVRLRNERGISELKPGLTGWAQITGRDELTTEEKVDMDQFYLDNRSLLFDFIIIFRTFFKVIRFSGVQH